MCARRKSARASARPSTDAIGRLELETTTLDHIVRHARHEIAAGGERLSELGASLQDIGGLPLSSGPLELRRAGVRAQADCTQAIVGLLSAMMSAERMALLASLREQAGLRFAKEARNV